MGLTDNERDVIMSTTYKRKPLTECSDEELLKVKEGIIRYQKGTEHSYEQELRMAKLFSSAEMYRNAEESFAEESAKHKAMGEDLQTELDRREQANEDLN